MSKADQQTEREMENWEKERRREIKTKIEEKSITREKERIREKRKTKK